MHLGYITHVWKKRCGLSKKIQFTFERQGVQMFQPEVKPVLHYLTTLLHEDNSFYNKQASS